MVEEDVASVEQTSSKQHDVTLDAIFSTALQRRCVYIVSAVALVTLLLAFAYSLVRLDISAFQWVAFIFGSASFLISALLTRSGGSAQLAAGILVTGGMVVTLVPAYYGAGVFSAVCIWFLLIPMMGGLLLGHRIAFIAGILGVLSLAGLAYAGRYSPVPIGMPQDVVMHTFNLMLGVVFCSGITSLVYKLMNQSALELIQSRDRAIEKQHELGTSWAIYHASINASIDAIVMIDDRGIIEMFNPEAERIYGVSAEQALGRKMMELIIPPRLRQDHAAGFQRYMDTGVANILGIRIETFSQLHDGEEFPVELMIQEIVGGDSNKYIAFIRDLTERNRLRTELEIREQQSGLDRRLEAIGRLSGGVAHDFNNLLMAINGYSELLLVREDLAEEVREYIEEIARAGEQAGSITRQLLEYSRKDRLEPMHINLTTMLEGLISMVGRVLPATVSLESDLEASSWLVKAEGARLEQAVLNLILNAADALPDGGTVWLRSFNANVDSEKAATLDGLKVGDYSCVEVMDQGIGMDGEVLKQIFEPLYTTKKRGEGTGLGLTNVVDIVNKSGGTISVLSAPNEGTAFTLYLPRAVEIEGYYSLPDSVEESNIVSDGTLLVVEDDQAVRKVLVRSLLADGFRVIEAEDGEQGYQLALQHAAQIDLVITDVVMPTLGGPEMIRRLIVTFPDLKVIFVSGYADDRLDPSDLDKSRSEFLSKPYTFKEMRGLINKLLLIN